MPETKDVSIKVRSLKTCHPVERGVFKHTVGHVKAADDVSLGIYRGEILDAVGESGCGKTTLEKSVLQLIKPMEGSIRYAFEGGEKELTGMNKKELDEVRCKVQIVFQDPYSSLNPPLTTFGSMQEPLIRFGEKSRKARQEKTAKLLEVVNLSVDYMERYPSGFSGGQRQRIGIIRVLSVSPEFIVCDEAASALDVSIQTQVLQLLKKLQEKQGLTYMLITHDLSVVEYINDRIVVTYLGCMVEMVDMQGLFENTLHPYIRALLNAISIADTDRRRKRISLQGDVPSLVNPPSGCPFHPRCPEYVERCKTEAPHPVITTRDGREHMMCCHRVQANTGGGSGFKTHI